MGDHQSPLKDWEHSPGPRLDHDGHLKLQSNLGYLTKISKEQHKRCAERCRCRVLELPKRQKPTEFRSGQPIYADLKRRSKDEPAEQDQELLSVSISNTHQRSARQQTFAAAQDVKWAADIDGRGTAQPPPSSLELTN